MNTVSVFKFIENSIASDNNEIVLVAIDPESCHIRIGNYNPYIAVQFCKFSLDVAKSTTNRKSTWENSMGAKNDLTL